MEPVHDLIDGLYALAPGEFTAARDALARRLKAEGDKDGAAEVKALRRPTVAAWAVNTVARDRPELVAAVYEAGAALGVAQRSNLAGGARDALRAATAARREAVAAAVRAAVALAGEAQREAVAATFEAAAAGDEAVRTGRLTRELEAPSGFGVLGDLPDLPLTEPESETADGNGPELEVEPAPEVDHEAVDAAEREVAAAKRALAEAEDRLARAEAALAELQPG